MLTIYKKAKEVIVWLGEHDWADYKHGADAIELVRTVMETWRLLGPEEETKDASAFEEDDEGEPKLPLEYLRRREPGKLAEPADDEPRYPWVGHRRDDLLAVVKRESNCMSTDSRDRIYALPGMSRTKQRMEPRVVEDDADNLDLRVDYTRPFSLVFQDLARYVMRREQKEGRAPRPPNKSSEDEDEEDEDPDEYE
ncbi:hypothetical protein LTR85_004530 [Meristemomyces frigidus]|nr:hypothetical protein LTR85_004530 [Meristemomyces frigidus]